MIDKTSINERIKEISNYAFNGNTSAMARATFIKQATLRDIISEKVKPSYETIKAIVECPTLHISSEWLITGEGLMLESGESNSRKYIDPNKIEQLLTVDNKADNDAIAERLRETIRISKLSKQQFAECIGLTTGILSAILSGQMPINSNIQSKIGSQFKINIDWLITGKGSMLKSEQMPSITERLKHFIEEQGVAEIKFCESIGMPYVFYTEMKGAIPERYLKNIITKYPQLNIAWLMAGEGAMLKTNQEESIKNSSSDINYEKRGAPYYNVDFIGGFDLVSNDQTTIPDYYIDYPPYNKPDVLWCNVTGHSMEPEIHHGDTMAIKRLNESNINYLPFGEVYAIVTDEYRTVKRISKSEKEGFIKLIPANKNPEYVPQEIPVSIIKAIFQVLVSVKRF